ncbi:MAG: D-amino-acid dehydrogenase [Flavobacterium sp.]|jgi:D-amino-acid dehydrogenase
MNEKQQVIIIGAGIVGVCSALAMQKKGLKVLLIDREKPGAGASFGNAGAIVDGSCVPNAAPGILAEVLRMPFKQHSPLSIKPSYLHKILPWLIRFILESSQSTFSKNGSNLHHLTKHAASSWRFLTDNTSLSTLIGEGGWLKVYESKSVFDSAQAGRNLMAELGTPFEILTKSDIQSLEPNLAPIYEYGTFQKDCLNILNPAKLIDDMVAQFVSQGGHYQQFSVNQLVKTEDGIKLIGDGPCLVAEQVLLATGAASKDLAKQMGDNIPLDTERGYHLMFPSVTGSLLSRPVVNGESSFVLSPMHTGIRMTAQVEFAGLDAEPNFSKIRALMPSAKRMLPELVLKEESVWMGCRPSLPDSLPVIGRSKESPRVHYAFGHHHLGMTLGAVTGLLAAQLMCGEEGFIDISPYLPNRF